MLNNRRVLVILIIFIISLNSLQIINAEIITNNNESQNNIQTTILTIEDFSIKTNILIDIENTQEKTEIIETTIDETQIKYWEHKINNIMVMNDSILLHIDTISNTIVEYKKTWTDIQIQNALEEEFEPINPYHWKKKIIFPQENDIGINYYFFEKQQYPLYCWEVRYKDGTTKLYNQNNKHIGNGISTPVSYTYSLKGSGDPYWKYWRSNAMQYMKKWTDQMIGTNDPDFLSYSLKHLNTSYFYAIAHSGKQPNQFLLNNNTYYTSKQLYEDMKNRKPITFAMLCCCQGMNDIKPGSLSHEFRKGSTKNTVVIGYVNMGSYNGSFTDTLDWQDIFFKHIERGLTVKKSFNIACKYKPKLIEHVRFTGDTNLKIENIKDSTQTITKKISQPFLNQILNLIINQIRLIKDILLR